MVAPVWGLEIVHRLDVSILDGTNTIPMTVPLVGLTNFPTVMEIRDVSVLDYRPLEGTRQDFFFDNDSLHFRSKLHCSSVVGYVHNVTGYALAVKKKGKLFFSSRQVRYVSRRGLRQRDPALQLSKYQK